MKLSYDYWHELWYQKETSKRIYFGANKVPIPSFKGKNLFTFDMTIKDDHVGPLIGIMASLSKDGTVLGNIPLFKAIQREALNNGGLSIVFTPEDINHKDVSGFIFNPEKDSWHQAVTPLPQVVYNRVPLRKTEDSPAFLQATRLFEEWNIPFFNPSFIDKATLYELVREHPFFKPLMPETILVTTKDKLEDFLKEHKGVYLKPSLSSRGYGIYSVQYQDDGSIVFKSHHQVKVYPTFAEFWREKSRTLEKRRYIAQVEVIPSLLDGKRFDFRVHAHDSLEGYKITGIGVRQSQKQSLTTHLPNGGIIIPYERVQTKEHDQFFSTLVKQVGELLTKELGYFGEFSIDAGITISGDYVLYEVNSKPMAFDEKKIENERIRRIVELLYHKAGFK